MVTQISPAATTRSPIPVIGGILSIISAGITLLFVLWSIVITHTFFAFGGLMIALLLSSVIAIIGGLLAIRRKEWLLALLGVAASIISFTGLLGIAATVLVAISKRDFNNPSASQLKQIGKR